MNQIEEYEFLVVILSDLKNNYEDHHKGTLTQMIEIIRYRMECLRK